MQYTAREKELDSSNSPINKFEEEFKQRKDILRKLGHIDMEDTVTLKACDPISLHGNLIFRLIQVNFVIFLVFREEQQVKSTQGMSF